MADPARATHEDVLDAPPHMIAEIIDGELRLQPSRVVGLWKDGACVRAEPFEAFELDLPVLWADVQLG